MGLNNTILLIFPILFTSTIFAHEYKFEFGDHATSAIGQFFPPITGITGKALIPIAFANSFPGLSNIVPFRQKRSVGPHKHENHEQHAKQDAANKKHSSKHEDKTSNRPAGHDNKLAVVTRITSCDYTARPGRQCRSCRESIVCYPNNRAVISRCYFIFRYCNNGRCSINPGDRCRRTTTSSTTTETDATDSSTESSSSSSTSSSTRSTTSASNSTSTSTSTSTATPTSTTTSNTASVSTSSPASTTSTSSSTSSSTANTSSSSSSTSPSTSSSSSSTSTSAPTNGGK